MTKGRPIALSTKIVKAAAVELREFTRRQLINALLHVMDEAEAGIAVSHMMRRDREIRMVRRTVKRLPGEKRIETRVYQYMPMQTMGTFSQPLAVGQFQRAIQRRSQTAANGPSGHPANAFTAPFRPGGDGDLGFPPGFDWDGHGIGFKPVPAIAKLQAMLRRPMGVAV